MSLVSTLPPELLLHITSFLSPTQLLLCSSVCGQFNTISKDHTLWRGFIVEVKTKNVPEGRLCHTGVVYEDKMYVFGGHTTQPASEYFHTVNQDLYAYSFDTREWNQVSVNGPKRTEHTTVVYTDAMYVFGGYSGIGYENSVAAFNFQTNGWTTLQTEGSAPSARSAHTAVLFNEKMYVFGGWNGGSCMNDLHELDLRTNTWTQVTVTGDIPCARCSHGAVIMQDGASGVMYIFGGYSTEKSSELPNKGYQNDLYEFHFDTNTWRKSKVSGNIPSPRSRFRMACHKEFIYLFAGWNSATHFNNLFQYSTTSGQWREIRTDFASEGIGQFSMVVHKDLLYVFSGFSPSIGSRTNLFMYHLNSLNS